MYGFKSLGLADDFNLDEAVTNTVIECLHRKAVFQEWVLVQKRPDTSEIFFAASTTIESTVLPSDSHVLVLDDRGSIGAMFGMSTVKNGPDAAYLLTLDLYNVSTTSLLALMTLRALAFDYVPLRFRDSDILEEICATDMPKTEIIRHYIQDEDRSCPVFIRRGSGISPKNAGIVKLRQKFLELFGPMIADSYLFNELKDGPIRRDELIAIDAWGNATPFLLSDEFTFENDIQEFFHANKPYRFDEDEVTLAPVSKRVLDIWRSSMPIEAKHENLAEEAQEYHLLWLEHADRIFNGSAKPQPDPELAPQTNADVCGNSSAQQESLLVPAPELPAIKLRPVPAKHELPAHCEDIVPWIEAHYASSIFVMPRAERALNKSNHPNPERIAASLRLLAEQKLACYSGKDRNVTHAAFEKSLFELHLRDTFTNAERLAGRTGDAYVINYDGRRLLLDRHLASQSSGFGDPRLLRIYYTFDRRTQKIVVGYLPDHLPTLKS